MSVNNKTRDSIAIMDDDVLAAMGISGFGKSTQKRHLDPARFEKTRREDVCTLFFNFVVDLLAQASPLPLPDSLPGPSSLPEQAQSEQTQLQEPEYDPDEFVAIDDTANFPITHELVLKDHTKVISALTLDPSGARVLSGSHDYDCKLWDFGGMDSRCKPFKTWEPAGSYHVRLSSLSLPVH